MRSAFLRFFAFLQGFLLIFLAFPIKFDVSASNGEPTDERDILARLTFFGESTTTHLRTRGNLPNGTEQVLCNSSGTMKLDRSLPMRSVNDPKTGEPAPLCEVLEKYQPEFLILSFGLNGITGFLSCENSYLGAYRGLISSVREASPGTILAVQTVYPVADAPYQTDWRFSLSPREINEGILRLNALLRDLQQEDGRLILVDTASTLTDEAGFLDPLFTTDGIHINEAGYRRVLDRLRVDLSEFE